MRRRVATVVVACVAMLVLAGCGLSAALSPATTAAASATPTANPEPAALPEGIVASGVLRAVDGGDERGRFDILNDGGNLTVQWHGLQLPERGDVSLTGARPEDPCIDTGFRLGLGFPADGDPADSSSMIGPGDIYGTGDPTFLSTMYLGANLGDASPIGNDGRPCLLTTLASGSVEWIVAPNRPWLAGLHDAGSTGGARGVVTVNADGRPASYRVVDLDLPDEVAARFGVSLDDLQYLNPTGPYIREGLETEQILNLDLASR